MTEQEINVTENLTRQPAFEQKIDVESLELREEVVSLNRVAKVVKGGRRFSFNALVVIGDLNGHVGVGFGKANEVPDAIRKGVQSAKKEIIAVPIMGRTIPHQVFGVFGAAKVMLKPASEGTGIIAGPAARAVLELTGVKDVFAKCLGTNNVLNVVKATIEGLKKLKDADDVAKLRGKNVEDMLGNKLTEMFKKSKQERISPGSSAGKTGEVLHPATNLTIKYSGDEEEEDEIGGFVDEAVPETNANQEDVNSAEQETKTE